MTAASLLAAVLAAALEDPPPPPVPPAAAPAVVEPERPTWKFVREDRPIKVVVVAGSIGALRGGYADMLGKVCEAVEVKNLSKAGLGAWALARRFREQVLDNPRVRPGAPGQEHWLLWGGGLNSVGMPERTNRHIHDAIVRAHEHGIKVVAFTLTPWGSEQDLRRFAGLSGLRYVRATRKVADFVMGRIGPRDALGSGAEPAERPWRREERPEVAVDLLDSRLRDRDATLRDPGALRGAIEADRAWQRAHRDLSDADRRAALERDVAAAAEVPRFFLEPELRSFDHLHPTRAGHRMITELACPLLPASWRCRCGGGT